MKSTPRTRTQTKRADTKRTQTGPGFRDALRVMIALVGLLFASLASVDRESPAEHLKASQRTQAVAEAQAQAKRARGREFKRLKPAGYSSHLNDALLGTLSSSM